MDQSAGEKTGDVSRQGAFSRALHSIRTRYSLATAFFVLLAPAVFYTCGRVALVHLMRESEQQVKEIGYGISRLDTVRLLAAFRTGAPHVPVIVSSGSPEDEMRKLFSDHPYDAFLAKPHTIDELRRALDGHHPRRAG